jgi:ABC-2 type transport system ATP-binding protein
MEYIMTTQNLTKKYGEKAAAKDINIHIREGEIYGLIGRNGAGKTTIMRMLSGLSNPTEGSFSLFGKTGKDALKEMKNVGVLIEHPGLYPNMTAYENLRLKAIAMGCDNKKYIDEVLELIGLTDARDKKSKSFSLGMRQRLGIGLALIGDPKIIILDEPINGLDPQGIVEVRKMLEKLRDEKKITIMISSHILDELGKLADSYGIIHEGNLVDEFTVDELHKRCGRYISVNTDDNSAAAEVIKSGGFNDVDIDEDGFIRINDRLDDVQLIVKRLVEKDLVPNHVTVKDISLEDYYLSVTGGSENG